MVDVVDDFTRRLLVDSGIGKGMRVLDIGCGSGDVALLAATLVGERGEVIGVDRDVGPLAAASDKAGERRLLNVTFAQGDIGMLSSDLGAFDAIVGRRVLMYQPDTIRAVKQLARSLRSGGVVVFQEHDTTMVPASLVPMPLHQRAQGWMRQTIEKEGADIHMGFNLHTVLTQSGLSVEQVRAEAIVQTPDAPYCVGAIICAMLPRIVRHGVASEEEIDIGTLEQRLDEERLSTKATYVGDVKFGAWARLT